MISLEQFHAVVERYLIRADAARIADSNRSHTSFASEVERLASSNADYSAIFSQVVREETGHTIKSFEEIASHFDHNMRHCILLYHELVRLQAQSQSESKAHVAAQLSTTSLDEMGRSANHPSPRSDETEDLRSGVIYNQKTFASRPSPGRLPGYSLFRHRNLANVHALERRLMASRLIRKLSSLDVDEPIAESLLQLGRLFTAAKQLDSKVATTITGAPHVDSDRPALREIGMAARCAVASFSDRDRRLPYYIELLSGPLPSDRNHNEVVDIVFTVARDEPSLLQTHSIRAHIKHLLSDSRVRSQLYEQASADAEFAQAIHALESAGIGVRVAAGSHLLDQTVTQLAIKQAGCIPALQQLLQQVLLNGSYGEIWTNVWNVHTDTSDTPNANRASMHAELSVSTALVGIGSLMASLPDQFIAAAYDNVALRDVLATLAVEHPEIDTGIRLAEEHSALIASRVYRIDPNGFDPNAIDHGVLYGPSAPDTLFAVLKIERSERNHAIIPSESGTRLIEQDIGVFIAQEAVADPAGPLSGVDVYDAVPNAGLTDTRAEHLRRALQTVRAGKLVYDAPPEFPMTTSTDRDTATAATVAPLQSSVSCEAEIAVA